MENYVLPVIKTIILLLKHSKVTWSIKATKDTKKTVNVIEKIDKRQKTNNGTQNMLSTTMKTKH